MSVFVDLQKVDGAVVKSTNSVFLFLFFVNVPIKLNWTGFVVTDVLVAAGRGVNVGVGVFFLGVRVGVALGSGVGTNVGDGGGPSEMVKDSSEKPAVGVGVAADEPLPPEQLRKIAPKTNNTTGEITSHLSHRDINIEP
jgi:hypothetical protein